MTEALVVEVGMQCALDLSYHSIVCISDCLNVVTAVQRNVGIKTFWARDVL